MAKLRCESLAERALIPAFVFFFQMLYPFSWVSDRRRTTAAAAGGCMLVRREALQAGGGVEAIRGSPYRRLRHGAPSKETGADTPQPQRARDQHPTLFDNGRNSADGRSFRLRPASLFAAAAGGRLGRPDFRFRRSGARGAFRSRRRTDFRASGLGHHGGRFSADAPVLRTFAAVGTDPAGDRARLHGFHVGIRLSIRAGTGRLWKGRVQARATEAP